MGKKLKTAANDHLFDAILSLENREECYKFFEDVCTINELSAISQRFEVAKMLREKKTYLDIAEKTGASTATISRVNRSLNYGNDAYDMVFERMNWDETEEQIKDKAIVNFFTIAFTILFFCCCKYIIYDFFDELFFHIYIKT